MSRKGRIKARTEPRKGHIKSVSPHVVSQASDVSISFNRSGTSCRHGFAFCSPHGFCSMLALLIACSSSQLTFHSLEFPLKCQLCSHSYTLCLRGRLSGSQPYHTWPELPGLPLRPEWKLPVILHLLYSVGLQTSIVSRSAAGWDIMPRL